MKNIPKTFASKFLNNYFLFFLYIVLVSFVSYHHEVWRDEADSWLVARDISISGLFEFTRNSGHPSLWYWILIPFAKLGFPNYTLGIVHLGFAIATSYLILFHSPFRFLTKFLIVFGYFLFFEYAVVARNYAISNLLLFLIASIYSKRFERPVLFGFLVFLLANCNVYATILASGIGVVYLIDILHWKKFKKEILFGLFLILLGGIVCFLQLFPAPNRQPSSTGTGIFHSVNFMSLPVSIIYSFAPGVISTRAFFSLLIIPISFIVFFKVRKIFIFYLWVISILLFTFIFIYMGGHRHAGFLLMTLIFTLWIKPEYEGNPKFESVYDSLFQYSLSFLKEPEKLLQLAFTISLILSVRYSFQVSQKDIRFSYSNAKEMATFMHSNGFDKNGYIVSAHSADRGKTVLYYFNNVKKFYYPGIDAMGSHMLWDKNMILGDKITHEEAYFKTKAKYFQGEKVLFLTDKKLSNEIDNAELLYSTKSRNEFIKDEEFFLYRINH